MPNLDIYLQDNGLLEYSRDLALTQYSTDYKIRLLTKKKYFVINMNATTGSGLDTYRKALTVNTIKTTDGYYAYERDLGLDITGYEFSGEKSTIKIAFYLYPDENDLSNVMTTSIVYLPLLKSLENRPYNIDFAESALTTIRSDVEELKLKMADLGYGETESAKDYNTETGTIKNKFDELEAGIQNLNLALEVVESTLGNVSEGTTTSIIDAIDEFRNIQTTVENNLNELQSTISELDDRLAEAEEMASTIEEIKSVLNTGLSYRVVSSLPTSDRLQGVVYLVPDNNDLESNVYTEYMWLNGAWEKLGSSRSEIDLTNYATKSYVENELVEQHSTITQETNAKLAIRDSQISDVEADISSINTTLNGKADKATTLAGYGITDAYRKAEVDSSLSTLRTELSGQITSTRDSIINSQTEQFNRQGQELISLDNRLSTNESLAQEAKDIALSKVFSKTFATKAEMLAWIQVEPGSDADHEKVQVGTDFYIKDVASQDYWVSAIFEEPTDYNNPDKHPGDFGYEVFYGTYYALEPIEVNLTNYYTKSEVDDKETALDTKIDQNVSNLTSEINRVENSTYTKEIIDNKDNAVKTEIYNTLEEDYATKALVQDEVDTLNATINSKEEALSERINTNASDIDNLESGLSEEINRAQTAETAITSSLNAETTTRINEDARVLRDAKSYTDDTDDALRTDLNNGSFVPYQAEGVQDYDNFDRIRFTTDLQDKDFEITEVDMTSFQRVLSYFEDNQY